MGGSDSSSMKFIMICFLIRGVVCRLCATPTKIEELGWRSGCLVKYNMDGKRGL